MISALGKVRISIVARTAWRQEHNITVSRNFGRQLHGFLQRLCARHLIVTRTRITETSFITLRGDLFVAIIAEDDDMSRFCQR